MYYNFIFDLDGTITDSRNGIINSYVEALKTLGHVPDFEIDSSEVIGPPVHEVMEKLLGKFEDKRISEGMAAHWEHYGRVGVFQNALYDGVKTLLETLDSQGYRLYVATAKRQILATNILKNLGILDNFVGVYGSGDDGSFENKSDLIAHLLCVEALEPGATIMIGDRSQDILGAHANGLYGIGVAWGYGGLDELRCANADHIVSSPAALHLALTTDLSRTAFKEEAVPMGPMMTSVLGQLSFEAGSSNVNNNEGPLIVSNTHGMSIH